MKTPLALLLVLSLAGNAALAFFVLGSKPASPATGAVASAKPAQSATPPTAVAAAPAATPPVGWQALKSGSNLQTLVDNLRAAGFPPSVVRATIRQLITDQIDRSALESMPFWKQTASNPEYQAAQAAIAAKSRAQFESLLGPDALTSASLDPATRARRYGNLSDDKIDRLEALNREYGELSSQLYAQRKTGDVQGTMAAQTAVEEEKRTELSSFLTPAEIEQYEMRSSAASSRVAANLKSVEVNEQEFTELFRAQKAFEAADPLRGGQTPSVDTMAKRTQAQDALNEQARTILGDDRFFEYLKGSDPAYTRAAQALASYPSVSPAQTYDLVKLEREFQTSGLALARTAASNPQGAAATYNTMRQDYQNKVNALIGEEAGKAFVQRNRPGTVTTTVTRPGGG